MMCTTEMTAGGGGGGGVGRGLGAAMVLVGASGMAYNFFLAHPYGTVLTFAAVVMLTTLVTVRRARRVARVLIAASLIGMWRLCVLAVRRRPAPKQTTTSDVATVRQWNVAIYERAGDTNRVVTRGVVEGAWKSGDEVEAETMHRAIQQFGWARAGELRAHAQLVNR